MQALARIYGWPHEALHVLALWLIGRRATAVRQTHVDIPADLTTGQYVFVAGLPALVFWPPALLGVLGLMNAATLAQAALALLAVIVFGLAAVGTIGDLYLIALRLMAARETHHDA